VFGLVAVSVVLGFFAIVLFVRNERVLRVAVSVFIGLILGGLTLAGAGAVVTGLLDFYRGRGDVYQLGVQLAAGALFGGSGGAFFYVYFVANVVERKLFEARKARHPDAPWMWTAEWESGTVEHSGAGGVGLVWTVVVVLSGGLGAVSYLNRAKIQSHLEDSPIEVIAFYSIFCLILLAGWWVAVARLRGHLKYGNSTFELSAPYGSVGGELAGTIHTRMRDIPAGGFELTLRCMHTDRTSRAKNNQWQLSNETRRVPPAQVSMDAGGVTIPVAIGIPADARESDRWSATEHVDWTLSAVATIGGATYFSEFLVPVFKPRAAAPAETW
jgi:hypothetical protein